MTPLAQIISLTLMAAVVSACTGHFERPIVTAGIKTKEVSIAHCPAGDAACVKRAHAAPAPYSRLYTAVNAFITFPWFWLPRPVTHVQDKRKAHTDG